MKPFCEIIVEKVLPPVRAEIAHRLSEKGMKQKDIAGVMGLTPAAVNQYMKKARGKENSLIQENEAIDRKLNELVERLAEEELSHEQKVTALCNICSEIRKQGLICSMHSEGMSLKECGVCLGDRNE